jgi:hypothetical protein
MRTRLKCRRNLADSHEAVVDACVALLKEENFQIFKGFEK